MKQIFYLVRHGEKVPEPGDPGLTALGRTHATQTGTFLLDKHVTKIIASPLLRTKETAGIISDIVAVPYTTSALLKERMNWGDDPSLSFNEFLAQWNSATEHREWKPPVGDSSVQSGERMESVIESEGAGAQTCLLVTHGGIIADYILNVFTTAEIKAVSTIFLTAKENCIAECSVTCIEHDTATKKYSLRTLASTEHLQ